ncbi:acyl-CoA dehydrogenase family protein [Rhizobium lusitanum]|uniref:acyl-CoA dehydrogenase family protein n=1 Tax=Rhizobium lusitanum TaxID=293958 RepID=UPI00195B2C5D|nr:acyl-CoA dehydrogenase family protein [Rhizobium lusitanum]MBM7043965.1 acyl-CoA/acyl-ACP dehydrogenase [Rhizobium lusitanum]
MSQSTIDLTDVIQQLADAAPTVDATGDFPWVGINAVHESGLLESTVGKRFGGAGASLPEVGRILASLGRGDPSVALISAMTIFTHLSEAGRGRWPEDLYRRLLAEAKERPILLNAARVEPDLGSPARGGLPETLARRTARGWSITGRKRFVTGALGLTHFLVWARTDEKPQRVGTFVVPATLPGIEVIQTWKSLGMRASGSHDVHFTDVEVPREDVLDLVDAGSGAQDNRAHAGMTLALSAIYLGAAEAAQDAFVRFAHERVPSNLGYPIARTERFISLAGEIDLLVAGARQIIFNALDYRLDDPETLIRARLLAGRQILKAAHLALGALGNPGLSADLGIERHFRDIQSVLVHAPQEDTAIAILGRAALARGQPPSQATASVPTPVSSSILKAG